MKQALAVVCITLLTTIFVHTVFGIQCYSCNSYDDRGCADFFNNASYVIHPCEDEAKYCRKIVQQTYYEGAWHMRFVRQCAKEGELDASDPKKDWNCYDKIGTFRVKVKYCHCRVDGCNSASGRSYSVILILFCSFLLLLNRCDVLHIIS